MMNKLAYAVAAAVSVATVSPGFAAILEQTSTGVSAMSGAGSQRVLVGQEVMGGTRLVVARGRGVSVVQFGNGCAVTLRPGQVYTVPATSPCEPVAPPTQEPLAGGLGPSTVGAGLVAAGVGAALFVGLSSKSNTPPPYYISR